MSGILEQIAADVAAIKAHLLSGAAATAPQTLAQPQTLAPATVAPANALAAAGAALGGAGVAYPPATQEMIVALVTPLVNDPNTKALLQAEMHAMNISALPEAQPHQYPELYARFQRVQQQVAAQQAQVQQPAATPASII